MAEILVREHGGEVPGGPRPAHRAAGCGRKTANVVLNCAFGEDLAVDTHIFRVGNRTGLAKGKTPLAVEKQLEKKVPQPFRVGSHHWTILHGRYVCKARSPECWRCEAVDLCGFRGKNSGGEPATKPANCRGAESQGERMSL
jgi:endonuclease-3